MIVLGIDPGTRITGYGLIESQGQRFRHVDNGCIIPNSSDEMAQRLATIFNKLETLIETFRPDVMAIEKVFFAKNAQSALKLGQCRGLALALAARAGLRIAEYSPKEIKKAVTGSGNAGKEQMQKMMRLLLKLPEVAASDASDALAVALCHAQTSPLLERQQAAMKTASGDH